jgi:hypothetical protein
MANPSRAVTLNISVSRTGVARAGFGVPMVAAYVPVSVMSSRYAEISDPDELIEMGLSVDDPAYRAIAKAFAQTPHPQTVLLGRRALPPTQILNLAPARTEAGFKYSFKIRGKESGGYITEEINYTNGADESPTSITTALSALVTATSLGLVASGTTSMTLTANTPGNLFEIIRETREQVDALDFSDNTTDPGISTDLAAIRDANASWYGLALDSNSKAEVVAAAAWARAYNILFAYDSTDAAAASGTSGNTLATLASLNEPNTFGVYKATSNLDWAGLALMARQFGNNPGTSTSVFKTLAGVYTDDLSETVITSINNQRGTCYVEVSGQSVTWGPDGGKVADGEWIDIVRGTHWLEARIAESILGAFVANEVIPFTDKGVEILKNAVRAPMIQATLQGSQVLIPDTVQITSSPISGQNRGARVFDGIFAQAELSGAIHKTTVKIRLFQ